MADLVGAKTELRRDGVRLIGLCPFHDERTPSFSVNAEKKVYYCFGCEASGDAIGFVMETEALDFPAPWSCWPTATGWSSARERGPRGRAPPAPPRAAAWPCWSGPAKFYAAYLWEADEAAASREYLAGRGLREETLREFGVGYAPEGLGPADIARARRDGFTDDELLAAGLAQRRREGAGLIDRFRGPDHVPAQRPPRPRARFRRARDARRASGPKYLNTSEGEVFHKGQPALWPRPGPCGSAARRAGSWWWRATPTCSPCTRPGSPRRWRSWAPR